MFTTTPDRNRPVPAAIDGRRWTVNDCPPVTGATDMKKALMTAPLGGTATARFIRNHELIHAKITPRLDPGAAAKKHGATVEALQWAEDFRVHLLQGRHGLVDADALPDDEMLVMAKGIAHDRRLCAGALMALMPLREQFHRLQDALVAAGVDENALSDAVSALREITGMTYSPFRGRRAAMKRKPTGFAKISAPLARAFDLEFPAEPPPAKRGEGNDPAMKRKLDSIRGAGKWGRLLEIVDLKKPLTVRPRRPIGRRFSDTGVIPSAVHRLPVDGSIFTTKRRARGGTILCDYSGSMSYCDEDIERILREAPAAKIAFYAGGRRGGKPVGKIAVAADRGRAAAVGDVRRALPGGENFIDGPALRWLARQPAPRFWVSDEQVGGVGDFGLGGPCHQECVAICRAANIRIIGSIDELK